MKAVILLATLFLLVFSFETEAQINYSSLDLKREVKALCHQVDRLQQGSYHYFDCLDYGREIQDKGHGLFSDLFSICSKSYVHRPLHCYSTVSRTYYTPRFGFQPMSYDQFEALKVFLQSQRPSLGDQVYWTQVELMEGFGMTLIDGVIYGCAQESEEDKVAACLQAGFLWLEQTLTTSAN